MVLGLWSSRKDQVFPVFEKVKELGLYLWDSAAIYGEGISEAIFGKYIQDTPREMFLFQSNSHHK